MDGLSFIRNQFMEMNENFDCDAVSVGQAVCVGVESMELNPISKSDDRGPLSLIEDKQSCFEFATIEKGDTCYTLSLSYNLNLANLQKQYDCDHLQIGDTVCVSKTFTCQHRYKIRNGDTCYSIGETFKLNATEIEKLNSVDCSNLPVDRKICVWSSEQRVLVNMTCTKKMVVENEPTCLSVSSASGITIDEFEFLNPTINCKNIKKGTTVCTSGHNTLKCASIQPIDPSLTCYQLAQSFSMSHNLLMRLNPTLHCDRLSKTKQVCTGLGTFKSADCTETMRVTSELDTCKKLLDASLLSIHQLQALNPSLDCKSHLNLGSLVCIRSLGMETRTAQTIVVSSLKFVLPELEAKFEDYLRNPNDQNSVALNQIFMAAIQRPDVNSRLKQLYKRDPSFKKILDNQHPLPRQTYCEQARQSSTSQEIKSCFCGTDELLLYCQALAVKEFQDNEKKLRTTSRRVKRSSCQFITPVAGKGPLDKLSSGGSACWGGECSIPFGLVEIGMDLKMCTPVINYIDDSIRFCTSEGHDCTKANPDHIDEMKTLADRSIGGNLKMCATGSSLIEKLTSASSGLCWTVVSADYHGFVGKLRIGSILQLIVLKLSGSAYIKVHGLAFPDMCQRAGLECEDYCRWRDWSNGKAYGYIEGRIFSVFGWNGIKIFDETIAEPKALGCQAGKETALVFRNDRTCVNRDDRRIWKCCWSGDDKCTFDLMDGESGLTFKPNFWGTTLFVCEFIVGNLRTGQKLGFDVYGGTSKNSGKKSFYYAVKNDGIYFGEEKFKEDQLITSWDTTCEGEEEVKEREERKEPTGQSSVPAARCGKRIVGYYTGWGDREITENQLKK